MPAGGPLEELIAAAKRDDGGSVPSALRADPRTVDDLDESRRSALHYTAEAGHLMACQLLLHAGTDPNARSME